MRLEPDQKSASALRELVSCGLNLLSSGQFGLVVERYGYAVAFGRDLADAVKTDLAQALQNASGSQLMTLLPDELTVVCYRDNDTGLSAAIDCEVPSRGGRSVYISFIVGGTKTEQFLTLEDIYAQPESEC